jgi:hypothetical protein
MAQLLGRNVIVLILVASIVINITLLSNILSTTNASIFSSGDVPIHQTTSSTAVINRAGVKSNNANNGEDIRIIALCGRSPPFHDEVFFNDAFSKIAKWLPISYAGMYQPPDEKKDEDEDETTSSRQSQRVWCEDRIEQWVELELQRRQISTRNKTTTFIEVIYSGDEAFKHKSLLNTTLVGLSKDPPKWEGGMHTPSRHTHFQRVINSWGEVASSKSVTCSQDDTKINLYRSRQLWSVAQEGCAVVHRPAILFFMDRFLKHRIQAGLSPENETMTSLLSRRLTHDQARQSLRSKSGFCILLTMTTFQPRYSTDALVRHALCRLLTKQYKPCVSVASWKGTQNNNVTVKKGLENTHEAMKDFKFAITMPNHFQDGYIAEKTLNPYLASSVAITSIPHVGKYVNADGMISCHLPEDELRKVQVYYKGNFKWMPFNTTPEMWKSEEGITPIKYDPYANNNKGDEPVLEFVTSQWEKALQPCIEEIIRVDRDDDTYIEKLMQPYLLNEGQNSIFDGTYVAMSMLRWFQWKNSPLVGGLEDQIRNLDGLWEQTPGWGKPSEKRFQDYIDYSSKVGNQQ